MKKKINISYLIIFALVQFPLRFSGLTFLTYIFIYLLPGIYLIFNIGWVVDFCRRMTKSYSGLAVMALGLLLLESCVWPILWGTNDFSFLRDYWFRFLLLMIKNLFLVAYYEKEVSHQSATAEGYSIYYLYSTAMYVLFSVLVVIFKDLRNLCVEYLYLTPKNLIDLQYSSYYTRIGWGGWSGFDNTMQCTVAVFLACILIVKHLYDTKLQVKYLFLALCGFVGNMLYGRTGLVVSILLLVITLVYVLLHSDVKIVFRVLTIAFLGIMLILYIKDYVPALSSWFDWAFSAFVNFLTTGNFKDNTGSVGHLVKDMYWIPPFNTFMFGDAYFTQNGAYYMDTDSGIMRLVLFYGVPNYSLGLIASFVLMNNISCDSSYKGKTINGRIVVLDVMLLLLVLLFELKGESYYKILCILLPVAYLSFDRKIGA